MEPNPTRVVPSVGLQKHSYHSILDPVCFEGAQKLGEDFLLGTIPIQVFWVPLDIVDTLKTDKVVNSSSSTTLLR